MRHHPLTVSGPKPAFKWSKHRRPPKSGEQSPGRPPFGSGEEAHSARYSAPHTRLLPELNTPSVRYLTQHNSIFDLCCADDTLFGVSLLSESWDAWEGVGDALRRYRTVRICYAVTVRPSDNSTAPRFPRVLSPGTAG